MALATVVVMVVVATTATVEGHGYHGGSSSGHHHHPPVRQWGKQLQARPDVAGVQRGSRLLPLVTRDALFAPLLLRTMSTRTPDSTAVPNELDEATPWAGSGLWAVFLTLLP